MKFLVAMHSFHAAKFGLLVMDQDLVVPITTLIILRTGGCDMSCTPIDSGVLFLLIGGGLFGGFMIKRRRETELMPLAAK